MRGHVALANRKEMSSYNARPTPGIACARRDRDPVRVEKISAAIGEPFVVQAPIVEPGSQRDDEPGQPRSVFRYPEIAGARHNPAE